MNDHAPTHLLASDDFVVLRTEDNGGARVQIIVLDALGGQFLRRQTFANDNGANLVPINLALAPDGTLVYLMPDRIRGKDLFEPGEKPTFEVMNTRNDPGVAFAGDTAPEHLQIADGRIVVLSNNGQYVRVHSLETGKVLRFRDSDAVLRTGASNLQALVRVVGPRIYTIGARELFAYDLDRAQLMWSNSLSSNTVTNARDMIVTQDHVIVLLEPAGPGGLPRPRTATPTNLSLNAISRTSLPMDGKVDESTTSLTWPILRGSRRGRLSMAGCTTWAVTGSCIFSRAPLRWPTIRPWESSDPLLICPAL